MTLSDPSGLAAIEPPAAEPETVLQPTGKSVATPAEAKTSHADLPAEKAAETADRNLRYDPKKDQGRTVGAGSGESERLPLPDVPPEELKDFISSGAAGPEVGEMVFDAMEENGIRIGVSAEEAAENFWNGWKYTGAIVLGLVAAAIVAPVSAALGISSLIVAPILGGLSAAADRAIIDDIQDTTSTPGEYAESIAIGAAIGLVFEGLFGPKPGPKVPPSSAQLGDAIGWGTGQGQVAKTVAATEGMTTAKIAKLMKEGLTKEWVEDQLALYTRSLAKAGDKLKNDQLVPRIALMETILRLWPK